MNLKRVYIEILNRCNLSCSFCPPSGRPARVMSTEDFERIAAAVAPHCRYVYLHVKGEPLMHPQPDAILAIAARYELMINLTTNGVLLPQKSPLLLASTALRQVNLSMHGYTPDTHGALDSWVSALCDYARSAALLGRYTVFRFWTLGDGRRPDTDTEATLALLEQQFGVSGLAAQSASHSITLADNIFISFDEQFVWPTLSGTDHGSTGRCYGSRTMVAILADGTVVPCCMDSEGACPLGNALTTPLDEILAGERLTRMAQGFTDRKVIEPLCRRCGYRLRFDTKPTHNKLIQKSKERENPYERPQQAIT